MALAPWDDSIPHCDRNCMWFPSQLERFRRIAAVGAITPAELERCEKRWVLLTSVWAVLDAARVQNPRQAPSGAFAIDARTYAVDWAAAELRHAHCNAPVKRMTVEVVLSALAARFPDIPEIPVSSSGSGSGSE
jgi:hypothetical protein